MSALRQVLLVLAAFVVTGALAGIVWEWVWTPPTGVALGREFLLDGGGLRGEFSGTALYVVVGTLAGLLLGVLVALLAERHELLTLVAVLVGAMLAGWLMLRVGTALGPPDPDQLARAAEDYTPIQDELRVSGRSPFVAFPGGALVGLIVIFVGLNRRGPARD
ncbi:MAG TPA: hypothetical protein VLO09_00710 [Ornithinimicrobium sp.]|nr:hypothetical protein [Ornithinimicrobium sp.]